MDLVDKPEVEPVHNIAILPNTIAPIKVGIAIMMGTYGKKNMKESPYHHI